MTFAVSRLRPWFLVWVPGALAQGVVSSGGGGVDGVGHVPVRYRAGCCLSVDVGVGDDESCLDEVEEGGVLVLTDVLVVEPLVVQW